MSFPGTRQQMLNQGYLYDNRTVCKGCRQEIEWWATPRRRKIPMNLMAEPESPAISHFTTCKDAPLFR